MTRALVVSGNGARGAFQAGVLSRLAPTDFDACYGTSSGAVNTSLFSYLGPARMLTVWDSIASINDVFAPNSWDSLLPALYSNTPIHAKALAVISSNTPALPVTVTVTDIVKWVSVFTRNLDVTPEVFAKAVADSATIPVLACDPDTLNLVDGGVLDDTPIDRAIADGHTDLTVMLADPFCETYSASYPDVSGFSAALNAAMRWLDRLFHTQTWNRIQASRGKVKITVYAPVSENQMGSVLDFSPANIASGIMAGMLARPQPVT